MLYTFWEAKMSIKNLIAKSVWNRLTLADKAALALIYMNQGKAAALREASKRAAKNIFS